MTTTSIQLVGIGLSTTAALCAIWIIALCRAASRPMPGPEDRAFEDLDFSDHCARCDLQATATNPVRWYKGVNRWFCDRCNRELQNDIPLKSERPMLTLCAWCKHIKVDGSWMATKDTEASLEVIKVEFDNFQSGPEQLTHPATAPGTSVQGQNS